MFFDRPVIDSLATGAILAAIALSWVVLLVRIVGLRSFSKMTSFDFVMTIAMGSMVASASQSQEWPKFLQTMAAMAALFVVQFAAAKLRGASEKAADLIQNEPVVLVRDGVVLEHALKLTRVSKDDLFAKMREANVLSLDKVRAVVLETTGNVSVLHGEKLDDDLLRGVQSTGDSG